MREKPLPPRKKAKSLGRENRRDGSWAIPRPVLRDRRSVDVQLDHRPLSGPYEEQICPEYWLG